MAKARKASKATSTRKKSAKKKVTPKQKPTAKKRAARKAPVRKMAKPSPIRRKKPASAAVAGVAVDELKTKLRTVEEDQKRQTAEVSRLRQKGEQLLHQLEAARETISNLRGQLQSGSSSDELDLDPAIEDDDLLDAEDPTYDLDTAGEDLNLLESRRRELDQARLELEVEHEGQTFWNICPKCGAGLEEFEFGGIKAERCESCGATAFERSEVELLLSVRPPGEILNRLQMLART